MLIIVEGLHYANDLTAIKEHPLLLDTPNKLVYSAQAFAKEISKYTSYAETAKDYDHAFGYIVKDTNATYHAPLWLGEFGTNSTSNYWNFTNQYIKERNLSYAYWAFNGDNNGTDETFGIVDKTWKYIRHPWKVLDLIKTRMSPASEEPVPFII